MESSGISSVSHNIALQWNLKVNEIPVRPSLARRFHKDYERKVKRNALQSNMYRLKDMQDLDFSLELNWSELSVKGHSRWSFQLTYAFAVVKERAFSVNRCKKLEFLEYFSKGSCGSEEEVALHCMILAQPAANFDPGESEQQNIAKEEPTKLQQHVEYEGFIYSKQRFDGDIPDFTVDCAEELIKGETTNRVLKVLASEYLMKNLSAENVPRILKTAIDEGMTVLQKQCADFLIKKCKVNALSS